MDCHADLLIIGAGVAGLSAALEAASQAPDARILLVSSHHSAQPPTTAWAQGGIAAAVAADDSPAAHARDTLEAAAGLADPQAVAKLTEQGPAAIRFLQQHGTVFDQAASGEPALTREGAHSTHRILHAHGDGTGREIWSALMRAWESRPQPSLLPGCRLLDWLTSPEGILCGARVIKPDGQSLTIRAPATILASGGYAGLFARTSVSPLANGLALGQAMMLGAQARDLEFVQFHPTCLLCDADPLPLISEAVRGEGALLINDRDERFMTDRHPLAELAPRDVVSRAIWSQLQAGRKVFLDGRNRPGTEFPRRFPGIHTRLQQAGIDPTQAPIPVTPASHYTMGGLRVDLDGCTSLPGLFACGEAACTGVHGANRLASNSLLEAVVFGRAAGRAALNSAGDCTQAQPKQNDPPLQRLPAGLRALLWQQAGIIRNRTGLQQALAELPAICPAPEHAAARTLAEGVLQSALNREHSVGAHFRADEPEEPRR